MTGAVDEMVDGRGGIRSHWHGVLGALSALDGAALAERVRRLALAAEDDGAAPSWRCDPVPLPLRADEFQRLEAGLVQRAELLELLLTDLYGPQAMLEEGLLPPALVHANPAYLRACRADGLPGRMLQSFTVDLVRGADGQWCVVADHMGGNVGVGYARECRRMLARVLPELFRGAQVRQLRPFFEAWGDALLRIGDRGEGRPPVVAMLTAGPVDPHWPAHLALSRDLGCALVEARDLTVRGGTLAIKTLQGLQRVDVLLRRVSGATLDPLEMAAGPNGVTGLLDVARDGAVWILNHPGTAAVEAPGLAAFLPGLCERLLGEALLLPSAPTLWLGEPEGRRVLAEEPGAWSVRSAVDPAGVPVPLRALLPDAQAALDAEIGARPWAYAACRSPTPSRAPCFVAGGLEPQPVTLRMFLMHEPSMGRETGPGGRWRLMPGGLARLLGPNEHAGGPIPSRAVFKDVWVSSQDSGPIQGPAPVLPVAVALRRTADNLPSRVADDFFWLGRHVERLDMQARLGRAGLARRARGAPLPRELAELVVVGRCLMAAGFAAAEPGTPVEDRVRTGLGPAGSIGSGLDNAARLIEALRDRMTVATHGALAHALRDARGDVAAAAAAGLDGLVVAMSGLQRFATAVAGVAAEGMVRAGGRLFLDLGRRIERGMAGGFVLGTVLDQPAARMEGTLRLALELCDSTITYQSRYLSVLQPAPVLDLVLADPGNPRALAFQFAQAASLLRDAGDAELADEAAAWLPRLDAMVAGVQAAEDPARAASLLAELLDGVGNGAAALSDRVTRRFFALLPALQSVGVEVA